MNFDSDPKLPLAVVLALALSGCGLFFCECSKPVAVPMEKVAPTKVVITKTDSDHDQVPNDDDQCPGTAPELPVDRKGCALIEKVVLTGVNFDSGSAALKTSAYDLLRSVAMAMVVYPELEVEVRGYSDSLGDPARNRALSKRRAEAVKEFLVGEGVAGRRLTVQGLGAADPIDTNATAEGRANNRRVGFKVTRDGT